MRDRRSATHGLVALVVLLLVTGCAQTRAGVAVRVTRSVVSVVAAENSWGSIAKQLGGAHASVTSVITNPNTDPHDYEPTVQDARDISDARLVVFNGAGYDAWVGRLLAASPDDSRVVLEVGRVARVPAGGNPHLWYSPADVHKVIARIAGDYTRLDPSDAAYFHARRRAYEGVSLAEYDRLIAGIRSRYRGTPVGASESVVAPLASALGLRMLTPRAFLDAISEGVDPTAADKATVDAQIRSRRIKVLFYNEQNATPDVTAMVSAARAAGIPVVTVTETMVPASATFQDWQTRQLRATERALKIATGR
jgi:zinc/manganese transport system substrate-binding protein